MEIGYEVAWRLVMKWREIGGSEVEIGYEVTWRFVMKW